MNSHPPIDPSAGVCRGVTWLAVLPDCDAASAAATRFAGATQMIRHASGRPWLLGAWPADDIAVVAGGTNLIVVLGAGCRISAELTDAAARARRLSDLDRLAARLPGSFHLLASIGGAVRVQGSLSGLRRVFHTRVDGVVAAADRGDVLAAAVGASVDPERLASCLLAPEAPYPFEGEVMWRGIQSLPEDHYLCLEPDGTARPVRWWTPPDPVLPLAEGARGLRSALTAAVRLRVDTGQRLSSDLSGGLDSTPVCYLAAEALQQRGEPLISVTTTTGDLADDDPTWADLAARGLAERGLPALHRMVIPAEDMPMPYADILRPGVAEDEPYLDPGDRGDLERLAYLLTGEGAQLHLTGIGGDEVLQSTPAYLRDLLFRNPARAMAHLRGYRALHRWSWRTSLRIWTDRRSYGDWLAGSARTMTAPAPAHEDEDGAPGRSYRLPPWATEAAAEALRTRVQRAAAEVKLLGPTLSQHEDLESVRIAGHEMRRVNYVSTRYGLPLAAPYLDDRVVEACLAVRPDVRTTPWEFKPLIVEAMRGVLPDSSLRRRTKAEGSSLHYAGLRAHRAELLAMCEDSMLAQLGLVNTDILRTHCTGMWTSPLWPVALTRTIGCERWLRDLSAAGRAAQTQVTAVTR